MHFNHKYFNHKYLSWVQFCVFIGILGVFFLCVSQPIRTDDFFWHLKIGELIFQRGIFHLPEIDPFLFTASKEVPAFYHEWFFQYMVFIVYKFFGLHGIRAFHVLLLCAITYRMICYLQTLDIQKTTGYYIVLGAFLVSIQRFVQIRPHLISILCFFTILDLIQKREVKIRTQTWVVLSVYAWVCANSHSMLPLVLLFAICGLSVRYMIGHKEAGAKEVFFQELKKTGVCILVGLINPKGIYMYFFYLIGSGRNNYKLIVDEWGHFNIGQGLQDYLPLNNALIVSFIVLILISSVVVTIKLATHPLKKLTAESVTLMAYSVLAVSVFIYAIRFSWLLIFPVALVMGVLQTHVLHRNIGTVMIVLVSGLHFFHPGTQMYFMPQVLKAVLHPGSYYYKTAYDEIKYPRQAVSFLKKINVEEGHLYHPYYLGGYLEYTLWPHYKMFLDGRFEHYSKEVYFDHGEIMGVTVRVMELIEKYELDFFILPKEPEYLRLRIALHLAQWIKIWDQHFVIYMKPLHLTDETKKYLAEMYGLRPDFSIQELYAHFKSNQGVLKHIHASGISESQFRLMVQNLWIEDAISHYSEVSGTIDLYDPYFDTFREMVAHKNQIESLLRHKNTN